MQLAWHIKAHNTKKQKEGDRYPYDHVTIIQEGSRSSLAAALVDWESDNPGVRIVEVKELRGEVFKRKRNGES